MKKRKLGKSNLEVSHYEDVLWVCAKRLEKAVALGVAEQEQVPT
jgi:hypothetical protein